ncbi:MAG: hypothetical protein HN348_26195 [Proteobacteria bacterium]|nr:hypothetical protein [Pseudomonadota bacterium]
MEELDTPSFLRSEWGRWVTHSIVAYNDITPFTFPNGREVMLMGLEASTPGDPNAWDTWAPGAWFLVRYPDETYELREIVDESLDPRPLVSTRTFIVSPFEEDEGRVIYAGGFDANQQDCHDTAWLYRRELVE